MFVRWPRLRMMWDLLFASSPVARPMAGQQCLSRDRNKGARVYTVPIASICRMAAGQDRPAALESATRVRGLRAVLCELDSGLVGVGLLVFSPRLG